MPFPIGFNTGDFELSSRRRRKSRLDYISYTAETLEPMEQKYHMPSSNGRNATSIGQSSSEMHLGPALIERIIPATCFRRSSILKQTMKLPIIVVTH